MKKHLNRNDHLFRIESDKFLISSLQIDSETKAEWFAECIRMLFDFPFTYEEREFHLNVNIGYTKFDLKSGSDMNALEILKEALHRSCLIGPNSLFYYDQNAIITTYEKAKIEIDLRKVLNRNELEIHFQPIIDLKENRFFLWKPWYVGIIRKKANFYPVVLSQSPRVPVLSKPSENG